VVNRCRQTALIIFLTLVSTALVWLPFFLRLTNFWKIPLPAEGMAAIMKNFDGLYYIVVARSFYKPEVIDSLFSFGLPSIYYAAHFPLYPLLIRLFSPVLGYLWSMLVVTLVSTCLAAVVFYKFLKKFNYSSSPLWLTVIFLFLPARWLVVRSIGSPEPLFILFILLSLYYFKNHNYWGAGAFGALAQLTRPPAILLFIAYGIYLLWQKREKSNVIQLTKQGFPLLLIPLTLTGLFLFYQHTLGDFLAYFHSGDNIHLFWPPFQIFNRSASWVGTFWLEEVVYIYLLGALGVVYLFRSAENRPASWTDEGEETNLPSLRGYRAALQRGSSFKQEKMLLAIFSLIFFLSTIFISHRDLSRYSLPLMPFLIIAFEPLLVKKEFKIAFGVILIPIFLYAINFIAGNTIPLADWTPFL
jgi:hypothetical protein